jgi:hypothetical protein
MRTMHRQHAVIWRLEQKPSTQLCFFAICVGLVSVEDRARVVATPSLRKIAPKEAVRKLPMRASLPRTAIGPQGLPIPSQLERILLQGGNMDDTNREQRDLSEEKQQFLDQLGKQNIEHIASIPVRERKKRTRALLTDDLVLQRLAKLIVEQGFRNRLEDIHAGTFPSSKSGDCTDIKVVSPYGEIPWNRLGRISDEEMKRINKGAVDYVYNFLGNLLYGNLWSVLEKLRDNDPLPYWDAPNQDHP